MQRRELVQIADPERDERWADVTPPALDAGLRAVLAVRSETERGEPAARSFHAERPHAFEALDFDIALESDLQPVSRSRAGARLPAGPHSCRR